MNFYRLLIALLLPPAFRRGYGDDLAGAVQDRLRGRTGPARLGIWILELLDLLRTAAREWTADLLPVARPALARRGDTMLQRTWKDIQFAMRTLRRAPAFTAVVVGTLALGIGANTAIFSLVDAVLLEQLPYPQPERMVGLWQDGRARGMTDREWLSHEGFQDVRAAPELFEAAGIWRAWVPALTGAGRADVLQGATVSHEMLSGVFGASATIGRLFLPEDDEVGAPGVAVLTHAAWRERFSGDASVLGHTLILDDAPYTIVGILPEGFRTTFLPDGDVYRALGPSGAVECRRGCFGWQAVARLPEGVALTQAQQRAAALGTRLAEAYPASNTDMTLSLVGLREDLTSGPARSLWVLLAAVGCVLLIGATNVANLILARAAARRGELSVRVALGAGRGELVRQVFTESLVLASIGGVVGLALAAAGLGFLLGLAPAGTLPRIDEVGLDGRILLFTAGVTILTALLVGIAPAWDAARGDVQGRLRASSRGATGGGRRVRQALAIVQVAMALVLLVGAGLLVRSFEQLNRAELGFDPAGVLTFRVAAGPERYPEPAHAVAFYRRLLEGLRALPGVEAAGASFSVPLGGVNGDALFLVDGEPAPGPGENQSAWIRPMTEGYLEAVGLPLVAGRAFTDGDDAMAPRVVIVNQVMADRYYDGDAVGKRLAFGIDPAAANWRTIVGVTGDVRNFGMRDGDRPSVYFPYRQAAQAGMAVAVRTASDPVQLIPAVRAVLATVDPDIPAASIQTMEELVDTALASDRFVTLLLAFFAVTAFLLAVVGIYGVIAYGVSRRYREMGIRMAVGADSGAVVGLVVRGGVGLVAVGVGVGLLGAALVTRLLDSLLYEVTATDPGTFVGTTLLLVAVGVLASWLPARRAGRTDLATVLREE